MRLMILLVVWVAAAAQEPGGAKKPDPALAQLLGIKRVFVDRLNGGETAAQMRDMIISSLQNSRLFAITENQDRADAILRGSAEDMVFTEVHQSSDGISARVNAGNGRNTTDRTDRSRYAGASVSERESSHVQERRHEAMASVRLVTKDGDVIWSATEESLGSKFRGSSADVADKITKRLAEDLERARKQR